MTVSGKGLLVLTATVALGVSVWGCNKTTKGTADTSGGSMAGTAAVDSSAATEQKNMDIAREFIDKVFNNGDTAFAAQHTAANFVDHNPSPGQGPGVEGFIKGVTEFRSAFPDLHMTVDDMMAKGDKVIIRSTMTGTNKGAMMGTPATNKPIKVEAIDIVTIVDGKQTEHWGQFDGMAMMTQMGMMPPMDAGKMDAGKMDAGKMDMKKDTMAHK
jgi:steroid delta-isomerase-like uncharacterized protein